MSGEWPVANIALIISGLSLLLALASFVWSVWSRFIHPKPKVWISIQATHTESRVSGDPAYLITGVNAGPGDIILLGIAVPTKYPRIFSRSKEWHLYQKRVVSASGGCSIRDGVEWPRRLKEGEYVSAVFPAQLLNVAMDYKSRPLGIGFVDTFERFHVLPEKGFRKLLKSIGVEDGH